MRIAPPFLEIVATIVVALATLAVAIEAVAQGADKLCQSKGFREGKSLGTDSAETCSAKVLIPGRQRKPDDCRTDTFVTTALCQ